MTQNTNTFYLFETQIDFIWKFGYTTVPLLRYLPDRYNGLNKYADITQVLSISVSKGLVEEYIFKELLADHGIKIVVGNEYFEYFGNINELFEEYTMISEMVHLTRRQWKVIANKRTAKKSYMKNRMAILEKAKKKYQERVVKRTLEDMLEKIVEMGDLVIIDDDDL